MIKPYQTFFGCMLLFSVNVPVYAADAYRVDYQIETQHANGVTNIQKYSEKMIRDDQNVWIERLNLQHDDSAHEQHDHQHDFSSAIQWIEQSPDQRLTIRYVLPDSKLVVPLQRVDMEMLGIHQCWRCYHDVFDRQQLARQAPQKQGSLFNYQWDEQGKHHQLIWDVQENIVKHYIYHNPVTRYRKQISVSKLASDIAAPWEVVQQYSQRDYADFSD